MYSYTISATTLKSLPDLIPREEVLKIIQGLNPRRVSEPLRINIVCLQLTAPLTNLLSD